MSMMTFRGDSPDSLPPSLWAVTAPDAPETPPLDGERRADVAIVGGGFTGLSAALHAAEAGASAMVLEAAEPGWGASGRNNGQVVPALKHDPREIEATFGSERAQRLIDAVGNGPGLVFGLIARFAMECEPQHAGVITTAHSARAFRKLLARNDAWAKRGVELEPLDRPAVAAATGSNRYFGGSLDTRGGGLNPLAYARGLARAALSVGAAVHGCSAVTRLAPSASGWRVETAKGAVTAEAVILATNAHTGDLWPGLRQSIVPARTPQVVSRPLSENLRRTILPGRQLMSDTRKLLVGCRIHADGRLHLGGAWATSGADAPRLYEPLRRHAAWLFPRLGEIEWEFAWSGCVAVTPDFYPHLHELAPGLLAGLGYSGRGIAMATLVGRMLADRACGTPLDELPLPASPVNRIVGHGLREPVLPALLQLYRIKDAIT